MMNFGENVGLSEKMKRRTEYKEKIRECGHSDASIGSGASVKFVVVRERPVDPSHRCAWGL